MNLCSTFITQRPIFPNSSFINCYFRFLSPYHQFLNDNILRIKKFFIILYSVNIYRYDYIDIVHDFMCVFMCISVSFRIDFIIIFLPFIL